MLDSRKLIKLLWDGGGWVCHAMSLYDYIEWFREHIQLREEVGNNGSIFS